MAYRPPEYQISIIVPFRAEVGSVRFEHFRWLKRYWKYALPRAELVLGKSSGDVFSKTEAVNYGVRHSHGRILAVLDADAYLPASVIQDCADRLDEAAAYGQRRWFIPYRALYRLTEGITDQIVASPPADPLRLPTPPDQADVESTLGSLHGRRYGAMAQVYPREAWDLLGGMDERFRGWGGEDIAFARALDTLYAKHKTTDNDVLHLWHPKIGASYVDRQWEGQDESQPNRELAAQYSRATGDIARMQVLVDQANAYRRGDPWWTWTWRNDDAGTSTEPLGEPVT